jgi:hypothetical protein
MPACSRGRGREREKERESKRERERERERERLKEEKSFVDYYFICFFSPCAGDARQVLYH